MKNFEKGTYGARISGVYDDWYREHDPVMVDLLATLARGGTTLELGIGTGRVALPLQRKGVDVYGIDASAAMLTRLKAKPGGAAIPVIVGDFAGLPIRHKFKLVYVVFNTFFALLEQEQQVGCFRNVATRLTADGLFAVEAFVPDMTRFDGNQTVRVVAQEADRLRLEATRLDPVRQQVSTQHVVLSEDGIRLYPVQLRYAWPAEMDLMAQLAGMSLQQRWGGWDRRPFTAASGKHISVYGLAT